MWTLTVLSCVRRSTSIGDRIRRESSSSQEASSRKDRHHPKGIAYSPIPYRMS